MTNGIDIYPDTPEKVRAAMEQIRDGIRHDFEEMGVDMQYLLELSDPEPPKVAESFDDESLTPLVKAILKHHRAGYKHPEILRAIKDGWMESIINPEGTITDIADLCGVNGFFDTQKGEFMIDVLPKPDVAEKYNRHALI